MDAPYRKKPDWLKVAFCVMDKLACKLEFK